MGQRAIINLWQDLAKNANNMKILDDFAQILSELELRDLELYQPQLLLARLYRKSKQYDKAHQQLVNFEQHSRNVLNCRIEIAHLAFARKNYDKAVSQLEKCFGTQIQYLPEKSIKEYFISLEKTKQKEKLLPLLDLALRESPNDLFLLEKQIELNVKSQNSQAVLSAMHKLFKVYHYVRLENFFQVIKYRSAQVFYDSLENIEPDVQHYFYWKLAIACGQWKKAREYVRRLDIIHTEDLILAIKVDAECKQPYKNTEYFTRLQNVNLSKGLRNLVDSFEPLMRRDWQLFIDTLDVKSFTEQEIIHYKPDLLLSRAFRKLGNYRQAHRHLVNYEAKNFGDLMLRVAIARLAFANKNYRKCISQFQTAFDDQVMVFSQNAAAEYCQSLLYEKDFERLGILLPLFKQRFSDNQSLKEVEIYLAHHRKKWVEILELSSKIDAISVVKYPIMEAKLRIGQIDEAYRLHIRPSKKDSYEYWELVADLAVLKEDWELAKYCYRGIVTAYPEQDKIANNKALLALTVLSR